MQNLSVSNKSVTAEILPQEPTTNRQVVPNKLRGLAASCGVVEGPCTLIRNLEDLYTLQDGAIVVCEVASRQLLPFMPRLRGLVAERGGVLSIASGYAREYEIPAVVAVKGLMGVIHNGDVIRVNGSRGTVDVIG